MKSTKFCSHQNNEDIRMEDEEDIVKLLIEHVLPDSQSLSNDRISDCITTIERAIECTISRLAHDQLIWGMDLGYFKAEIYTTLWLRTYGGNVRCETLEDIQKYIWKTIKGEARKFRKKILTAYQKTQETDCAGLSGDDRRPPELDPVQEMERAERSQALTEATTTLTNREMQVVIRRFEFYGSCARTVQIADDLGISKARVSKLEKCALAKIGKHLKRKGFG